MRFFLALFLALSSLVSIGGRFALGAEHAPATGIHVASATGYGLQLSIETPLAAYPPDALVMVIVRLRNVSRTSVFIDNGCGTFNPSVELLDASGHSVGQPILPQVPNFGCDYIPPAVSIAAGAEWSSTRLLLLRTARLRASVAIGKGGGIGSSPPIGSLRTPVLTLGTLPARQTPVTLHTSPSLHASVAVPPNRSVYYSDHIDCTTPYGETFFSGTAGWELLDGRSIAAPPPRNCTAVNRWQLVVAALGQAPSTIDYRAPVPPLLPGNGISAPKCNSSRAATRGLVAAVWHGAVYVVGSGGACRLTPFMAAASARLSPTGQWVAFTAPAPGRRLRQNLWIAATSGHGAPRRLPDAIFYRPAETIAWSPGGRHVAYEEGSAVIVRNADGSSPRTVIPPNAQYGISPQLAWSPNGASIAVVGALSAVEGRQTVQIPIGHLGGTASVATVQFPPWISNPQGRPHGSFPWQDIAFTADGQHVLLTTTGGGVRVSGIWEAPVAGGKAQLVVGTRARVRGYPSHSAHLLNATHMLGSSDGRYLVVDPRGTFWLMNPATLYGRTLTVPDAPNCVLSQWLPARAQELAYVTTCALSRGGPFRSTLWSMALAGGAPHQLLSAIDRLPDAIRIAPVYRCVRCGFNPGP